MNGLIPWKRHGSSRNGSVQVAPVSQMRLDWDRLFDRILDDAWSAPSGTSHGLPLDISETGEEVRVRAEVPGVGPEDLDISLVGDTLSISGEKQEEAEHQDGSRYYSERQYGSFKRTIKLPCPVDPEQVSAEHKHGVLTVILQKAETVRPKRIAVKGS